MIYKIRKINYGTTHRIAQCLNCSWNDAYSGNEDTIERVAQTAKKHAKENGHRVLIESGPAFAYYPE